MRYGMDVLRMNLRRKFVICVVSNLENIVFIKVERKG